MPTDAAIVAMIAEARTYLATLFSVDPSLVFVTAKKHDRPTSNDLLAAKEIYYTEATFEVRVPGVGLQRELDEAAP